MKEDYLIHHGVKGMRWNVRKTEKAKKKSSTKRLVEEGAVITTKLLNNYGSVKIETISEKKKIKTTKKTRSKEPSAYFTI